MSDGQPRVGQTEDRKDSKTESKTDSLSMKYLYMKWPTGLLFLKRIFLIQLYLNRATRSLCETALSEPPLFELPLCEQVSPHSLRDQLCCYDKESRAHISQPMSCESGKLIYSHCSPSPLQFSYLYDPSLKRRAGLIAHKGSPLMLRHQNVHHRVTTADSFQQVYRKKNRRGKRNPDTKRVRYEQWKANRSNYRRLWRNIKQSW